MRECLREPDVVISPDVVPAFAESVTVVSASDADVPVSGLPFELRDATVKRQREFIAGRYCAARAVGRLSPASGSPRIGRGPEGEPLWPAGLTGSITHSRDLASAVVARVSDARSLGIDSEPIADAARACAIRHLVMLPSETTLGGTMLDEATRFTFVFSAKEAIFKCLFPVVRRRFYFAHVEIGSMDGDAGTFAAELMTTLADGFARGMVLHGRFEIDDRWVHTGVWLAPDDAGQPAAAVD